MTCSPAKADAALADSRAEKKCPCCGNDACLIQFLSRERILRDVEALLGKMAFSEGDFGDYQMLRCSVCGLEFSAPMQEPPPHFYDVLAGSLKYPATRWEWRTCTHLLREAISRGGFADRKIVLDVGCGNGLFLQNLAGVDGLRAIGLDINCQVVEACRARGLEVLQGTLNSVREQLPQGLYAVTMWHVVEHVADPVGLLTLAKSLLEEGGKIYFSVPLSPMSYEIAWPDPLNAPPHHLTRWGVPALQALADRLGMTITFAVPNAEQFWVRVVRALSLQAVSPFAPLSRNKKIGRLFFFVLKRPWRLLVEMGRQLRHPRLNGRPRPDVVLACLHKPDAACHGGEGQQELPECAA
jgi:SAM-dependent methyltransferase